MAIAHHFLSTEEWESTLGDQVRQLRLQRQLDQQQLADAAGVSIGSVKNLERGRGSTLKTLVRVARALGRDDWLAAFAPRVTISPIDVLRSTRAKPRQRVYRPRTHTGGA